MPDGDYLVWRAGGRWRKVANLLKSGASSVEIEDAVASAVANSIRASGGVPRFPAVVDSVRLAAAEGGTKRFAAIPSSSRDGTVGRLLDEVAPALAATMQERMRLVSPASAAEVLAERFLQTIVHAGLDHTVPTLVADGSYTMPQLRDLFDSLSKSKPMEVLRGRFIRHPSGEGLIAPRRRTPTKPLAELLTTGLDDL